MKTAEQTDVTNLALADQTFAPLGDLVIVQFLTPEKSPGGVLIPESARRPGAVNRPLEEVDRAQVVAVGAQCKYVRRGDVVITNGNWPHFKFRGVLLYASPERQVVGIVQDKDGVRPEFKVLDWETMEVERLDTKMGGDVEVDEEQMAKALENMTKPVRKERP